MSNLLEQVRLRASQAFLDGQINEATEVIVLTFSILMIFHHFFKFFIADNLKCYYII
jgi:hypothetical protein